MNPFNKLPALAYTISSCHQQLKDANKALQEIEEAINNVLVGENGPDYKIQLKVTNGHVYWNSAEYSRVSGMYRADNSSIQTIVRDIESTINTRVQRQLRNISKAKFDALKCDEDCPFLTMHYCDDVWYADDEGFLRRCSLGTTLSENSTHNGFRPSTRDDSCDFGRTNACVEAEKWAKEQAK